MTEESPATLEDRYGGFCLGAMELALPMSNLREVVRYAELDALPCRAPWVLGGMNLRGSVVPVVDLRVLLEREASPLALPCVVIMAHRGRLLGLLAERVTGVFSVTPGTVRRLSTTAQGISVIAGSVHRHETDALVTILSPDLLSELPQVPMVDDGQTSGQPPAADTGMVFDANSVPVMLLRCQKIAMAIDAMAVHSTLANPAIGPAAVAVADCRGTIEYTGMRVPVVDLLEICGLGRLDITGVYHAFVVQLEAGFVAFLVDEVIDVVRTRTDHVVALAAYAFPEPGLFAGTLPAAAVTPVFTAPADCTDIAISQYLVLDTAGLKSSAAVAALAATNVAVDRGANAPGPRPSGPAYGADKAQQPTARRMLVTFESGGEFATPLEQVVEILPYHPDSAIFPIATPLVGLVVNRGRSIPLFCLRRLAGKESQPATSDTRVLVVQSQAECVGFVVDRVSSIENAHWSPKLPTHCADRFDPVARVINSGELALIGVGAAARMLRVLDLENLSRAFGPPVEVVPRRDFSLATATAA